MKTKCMKFALLFFLTAALCSVTALAAEAPDKNGVYDVQGTGIAITPQMANEDRITAETKTVGNQTYDDYYPEAVRFEVVIQDTTPGEQYLIVVTKNLEVPTEGNIVYIDQQAATGSTVTFEVYPSSLAEGLYSVWYTSTTQGIDEGRIPAGSFRYYMSFILGDVTNDGNIRANDALEVLRHFAGVKELTGNALMAADVNKDGAIRANDALQILRYFAGQITSF